VVSRLGRYDVLKPLIKSELTDLLLARADGIEGFQRHVAIKRLHAVHARDKACFEAFVNEARLAAALHHHNIVQVLDIGEQGGQPYFAMEYVHGVDLRGLLNKLSKRSEQLPLQHVVSIIAAAAAALHHAHEQRGPNGKSLGIVHRDVTPGNILVGFDGNVKVVDFGIAKAAIKRMKTDHGVLKGRVPYMAPEQCAGKSVDRRSDVFALGVVAYELATVRRLFKGASEFLTMSAIVNGDIPKPSQYRRDIPPALEAIMMKALARDPRDRFATAGEMAVALDRVAIEVGVGASTTALANYMRLQFGEVKEPWLLSRVDFEVESETTEVDFDGGASGLAPPPPESVKNNAIPRRIQVTRSAPISQVRNLITPARPAEIDKSYSVTTDVDPPPFEPRRASTDSDLVPPLPAPPKRGSDELIEAMARDVFVERPVVDRDAPRPKRRGLWVGLAAVLLVVGVAAAIVLWPTAMLPSNVAAEQPASSPPPPPSPVVVAPEPSPVVVAPEPAALPPPQPEPEAEPEAEPQPAPASALAATMSDYQADAGVPEVAVDEETPVAAKVAPTPVAAKSPPPKRESKRSAPVKRTKQTAKKPTTKPKWNPDQLFLGD
jgi:serine/threonine-protein kinase